MINFLTDIWDYVIVFLLILTVVVFVHEMGHFLVARWCGVKIETFSIGFGPEVWGRTARSGTRWKISLLPLGGYVKMFGDSDAASTPDFKRDYTEAEKSVAFFHKSVWQRAAIVVAGPMANFIFGILVMALLLSLYGAPRTQPVIGQVQENSAAAAAGLHEGDRILVANGQDIASFQDLQNVVRLSVGEPVTLLVARADQHLSIAVEPHVTEITDIFGTVHKTPFLGIAADPAATELVHYNPATAVIESARQTAQMVSATLTNIGQMILGQRDSSEIGGPLRIAKYAGAAAKIGILGVVNLVILLSINLGLFNLFPVPLLDGGHLLFCAIEALRGRPLGQKAQEYGFRVGLFLVFALMLFSTRNDLLDLHVWDFIKRVIS